MWNAEQSIVVEFVVCLFAGACMFVFWNDFSASCRLLLKTNVRWTEILRNSAPQRDRLRTKVSHPTYLLGFSEFSFRSLCFAPSIIQMQVVGWKKLHELWISQPLPLLTRDSQDASRQFTAWIHGVCTEPCGSPFLSLRHRLPTTFTHPHDTLSGSYHAS